ncbi:Protein of unknown function [Thermomonospora echinospora]|uniref:DUF3068 domain-containing protein n=1 Tax=Thermomonospora echinospora TaxID=1992 RepID=A0A1H5W506_9ACTN|nr:DUF3068 domain-containing protein [Thermomonospora echinospora]SEF94306.1 Protein of unknown function [Thermomonospora echinospora]
MRRPLGLVLVGLGSFLLALAPLVRFYVTGQVVRAPLNFYQATELEARDAQYYDLLARKVRTGVTLAAANTVRGDTRANRGDDGIAVWDSITEIYDKDRRKQVEFQTYRIAFDRRTSELVNCCGSHVGGDTRVRMSGYGLLFPLGNVQRRDYPVFDMSTRRSLPMRFDGEERIHGLNAYRFVQQVPNYRTAKIDLRPTGEMLGLRGAADRRRTFKVDRYFSATITVWVDPRTGIPIKHDQNIRSTVETEDGRGKMVVAAARLVTVDRDQRRNVDTSNGYAFQRRLVESVLPIGGLAGGLVLLALGAFISMRAPKDGGTPRGGVTRKPDGRFGASGGPSGGPAAGGGSSGGGSSGGGPSGGGPAGGPAAGGPARSWRTPAPRPSGAGARRSGRS